MDNFVEKVFFDLITAVKESPLDASTKNKLFVVFCNQREQITKDIEDLTWKAPENKPFFQHELAMSIINMAIPIFEESGIPKPNGRDFTRLISVWMGKDRTEMNFEVLLK